MSHNSANARNGEKMSNTNANAEGRTLVPAAPLANSTVYTKLGDLSSEQQEKGYYVSLASGGSIAGVLAGSVKNKFGKNDYSIERADGKTQVIAGAGNLDRQLAAVTPGTYVVITYNGMKEIQSGQWKGKDSHNFLVEKEQI